MCLSLITVRWNCILPPVAHLAPRGCIHLHRPAAELQLQPRLGTSHTKTLDLVLISSLIYTSYRFLSHASYDSISTLRSVKFNPSCKLPTTISPYVLATPTYDSFYSN